MKQHLTRLDRRYKCPVDGCSEFQTRRMNVRRHITTKHKGAGDEIFSKVDVLVKQEFQIILDGEFVCFNCNQQFAAKQNLAHHDLCYHQKVQRVQVDDFEEYVERHYASREQPQRKKPKKISNASGYYGISTIPIDATEQLLDDIGGGAVTDKSIDDTTEDVQSNVKTQTNSRGSSIDSSSPNDANEETLLNERNQNLDDNGVTDKSIHETTENVESNVKTQSMESSESDGKMAHKRPYEESGI